MALEKSVFVVITLKLTYFSDFCEKCFCELKMTLTEQIYHTLLTGQGDKKQSNLLSKTEISINVRVNESTKTSGNSV